MPTTYQYAMMSQAIYNPGGELARPLANWRKEIFYVPANRWGLTIGVYMNDVTREIIISFRGTELGNIWNLFTDFGLWRGQLPPHIDHAEQFAEAAVGIGTVAREAMRGFVHQLGEQYNEQFTTVLIRWVFIGIVAASIAGVVGGNILVEGLSPVVAAGLFATAAAAGYVGMRPSTEMCHNILDVLHANEGDIVARYEAVRLQYPDYRFSFTGHSLGSIYAELMACRFNVPAVTFESPGSRPLIEADERFRRDDYSHVITHLAAPNPINTLHPHVGAVFRVKIPHLRGYTSYVGHGVKSIGMSLVRVGFWAAAGLGTAAAVGVPGAAPAIAGAATAASGTATAAGAAISATGFTLAGIAAIGFELWGDTNWINNQHALANMLTCFQPETNLLICTRMRSWPDYSLLHPAPRGIMREAWDTLRPFPPDRPDLRTFFWPNDMHEVSIRRLPNYEEGDQNMPRETSAVILVPMAPVIPPAVANL